MRVATLCEVALPMCKYFRVVRDHLGIALAATVFLTSSSRSFGQWSLLNWKVEEIGLYDSEHKAPDGSYWNSIVTMSAGGMVIGTAKRFVTGYDSDRTAWVWLPDSGTTRIRFDDALYVAPDGTRNSVPKAVNSRNEVVGESMFYFSQTLAGQSAWYWSPQTGIVRIGLLDAEHTTSEGVSWSFVRYISDEGFALGSSYRFNDIGGIIGNTPWVWSLERGTIPIGLVDDAHTSSSGRRNGIASYVSRSGIVTGWSRQYPMGIPHGISAWVWSYDTGTMRMNAVPLGEDPFAYQNWSLPYGINASGDIIMVNGGLGSPPAWLYSVGAGYVPVGLLDEVHQGEVGQRSLTPLLVSDSRWVAGTANRYDDVPDVYDGVSAWVWNEQLGAVRIGQANAAQSNRITDYSKPLFLHESGRVYGQTSSCTSDCALESWTWSPDHGTTEIGFIGTYHPVWPNYSNTIKQMNSLGQVLGVGYSTELLGSSSSAWVFDPVSAQTYFINHSGPDGGPTTSTPISLTDEGVALGYYQTNRPGQPLVWGTFIWSVARGFGRLNDLLSSALDEAGFMPGAVSVSANAGNRRVVGYSTRAGLPGSRVIVATFSTPTRCAGDANLDGHVNFADLTSILQNWGGTTPPDAVLGDADSDGMVTITDITAALEFWGHPCSPRTNQHGDLQARNEP